MIRFLTKTDNGVRIVDQVADLSKLRVKDVPTWVDISKPNAEELKWLSEVAGFHQLAVEDCLDLEHIPKFDKYEDHFFLRFVSIDFHSRTRKFTMQNVACFLKKNLLVTVSASENPVIDEEFNRHKDKKTNGFKRAGLQLYHVLDMIMDRNLLEIGKFGAKLTDVEGELLKDLDASILSQMMKLRKGLYQVHRMAVPLVEVVHRILGDDIRSIRDASKPYFRDLYDDVYRFMEIIVTYRDQVSSAVEFYLSLSSHRMNEVMKIMTVFATVLLPLTFITGLYGMNFRFMPELDWEYGYPVVLGFMFLFAIVLLWYFKRKKWF